MNLTKLNLFYRNALTLLSLCHTVIVESKNGELTYNVKK